MNALIKIEMGIRPVYDFEVAAISAALDVASGFLLGLTENPSGQPVPAQQSTGS